MKTLLKKKVVKVILAAVLLAAVGFGIYALTSTPAQLSLDKESMTLQLGEAGQLTATTDSNDTLIWYAENESVAYVDPNGCVTALGLGETRLVCYVDHAYAYCDLTVTDGRERNADGNNEGEAQNTGFDTPAEKKLDTEGALLSGTDANGQTIVFNADGSYAVSGYFYYMDVVKFVYDVADTYVVENGVLKLNNTGRLHCDGPQNFSYDIATLSTVNVSDNVMIVKIIGDGPDGPVLAATFTFSAADAAKLGVDVNKEVHADDPVIPVEPDEPDTPDEPVVPDAPEGAVVVVEKTNSEGQKLTIYSNGSYSAVGMTYVEAYGIKLPFQFTIKDKYTVPNGVFTPSNSGTVDVDSEAIGSFTMIPEFTVSTDGSGSTTVSFVAEADSGIFTLGTFVLSASENAAIAEKYNPGADPGDDPSDPVDPAEPEKDDFLGDIAALIYGRFQEFLRAVEEFFHFELP